MQYEIIGDNQQMVKIDLQPGEGIFHRGRVHGEHERELNPK